MLKELLGTYLSDSFSPRTCIRPSLTEDKQDFVISYQSMTTRRVKSDEGRECLNDIELSYLFFLAFTLLLGLGMASKPECNLETSCSRKAFVKESNISE